MFRSCSFTLAALAGCLLFFNSCEQHQVGELPELQQEHLHPLDVEQPEGAEAQRPPRRSEATPANFFPSPTP
ncbi:MAG TPA: hypothetical protein VGI60_17655 [Chthoniobacterales bacterium]